MVTWKCHTYTGDHKSHKRYFLERAVGIVYNILNSVLKNWKDVGIWCNSLILVYQSHFGQLNNFPLILT